MNQRIDNRAALLIDADNLSPEGMEQALSHLRGLELNVCVRRAYGSHETLAAVKDFLQANSVRAIINQGKGTTDAALVVDAMDLLHAGALPALVAIGSGDADFAPLVLRLREAGRQMVCFAQPKKAAEGLDRFYGEVIHVGAPVRVVAKRAATAARKTVAKAPAAKAPAARPQAAEPPQPDGVREVLESFPGFLEGQEIELNAVVKRLRDQKLMAKNTSARNFFKKHAADVQLLPESQPNKLRRARR